MKKGKTTAPKKASPKKARPKKKAAAKAAPKKRAAEKKAPSRKVRSGGVAKAFSGKPKTGTAGKAATAAPAKKPSFPEKTDDKPVCIVGIGVSGGGLEAMEEFLSAMPADTGIAFVLVPHLDPTHSSMMADLLKKYTHLEALQADDGMKVKADRLYVIPPGKDMAIMNGSLQLLEPHTVRGMRHPIDFFFRALAKDQGERAVCIVMSGAGTDGTLGLKDIKGEGGMVMVQEPASASYDGMPQSAVDTGLADFVLPPEKMPEQLIKYVRHPYIVAEKERDGLMRKVSDQLDKVMLLIRNQTGHDFSYYKENTIIRRIERRMNVNQITEVSDYVTYLQRNPAEVETLFKELLIGVTNFFRDPEAFEALKKSVLPEIFKDRPDNQPVRVWVPGCSTGEEAYSISMAMSEYMEKTKKNYGVQIFATDIDAGSIDKARAGIYPESIANDVSTERLKKFFIRGEGTYQIKKSIREMAVFAAQDMIKDPPFTKLDLVSCRNLLIYLSPKIQKKLLPLFQFVLNPDGFLFLGSSESIGEATDMFSVVDKKWKIYKRKGPPRARPEHLEFPAFRRRVRDVTEAQRTGMAAGHEEPPAVGEAARRMLMEDYAPPCVVINEKHNILYIHGKTGKYLEPAPGEARLNILDMAREGLEYELGKLIRKAVTQKKRASSEGVQVKYNGSFHTVDIEVRPIAKPEQLRGHYMVVFREPPRPEKPRKARKPKGGDSERIAELERELASTKEYLQHVIEEQETTNEELQSTNEELHASNEELQSTNEELETSKEEIQSVNEELATVNSELQDKIDELSAERNDLNNLLSSTNIAVVFLDNDLRVKRFTPAATQIVNLINSDVGRPIGQITTTLEEDNLVGDAREVLRTVAHKEKEVKTRSGEWFLMRILPYRTTENVIEGVVMSFVNISGIKHREYAESIVDTVREPLLVLDKDLRVMTANESFYSTFQVNRKETEKRLIFDLGNRQWDIPRLRHLLEEILPQSTEFNDFLVEHDFPEVGHKKMLLNARRIYEAEKKTERILLAIEDVTGQGVDKAAGKGRKGKS